MSDELRGYFAGVLTGAVVGAVLGLLFAPAPGQQTRRQLRELGEQTSDRVRGGIDELSNAISGLRSEIAGLVKERLPLAERLGREAATAADVDGDPAES